MAVYEVEDEELEKLGFLYVYFRSVIYYILTHLHSCVRYTIFIINRIMTNIYRHFKLITLSKKGHYKQIGPHKGIIKPTILKI